MKSLAELCRDQPGVAVEKKGEMIGRYERDEWAPISPLLAAMARATGVPEWFPDAGWEGATRVARWIKLAVAFFLLAAAIVAAPPSPAAANVSYRVGLPCARSSLSDRLFFRARPANCTTVMTGYGLAGMVRLRDLRWTGWRRSVAIGRGTWLSTRAYIAPAPVTVRASRRRVACNGRDAYYSRLRLGHGRSVWVSPSCEGDYLVKTFRAAMRAWLADAADEQVQVEDASCDFGSPGVWRCRGDMTSVVDRRGNDLVTVGERCRYHVVARTAGYAIHRVSVPRGCEEA